MGQFLTCGIYLLIVQFELPPEYFPYGTIPWNFCGGFATLLAVCFSTVTAKVPSDSPLRLPLIISMEVAIQTAAMSGFFTGLVVEKWSLEGIKSLLWAFVFLSVLLFARGLNFVAFFMVVFGNVSAERRIDSCSTYSQHKFRF